MSKDEESFDAEKALENLSEVWAAGANLIEGMREVARVNAAYYNQLIEDGVSDHYANEMTQIFMVNFLDAILSDNDEEEGNE